MPDDTRVDAALSSASASAAQAVGAWAPLLTAAVLASAMGVIHYASAITVTLVTDGVEQHLVTRAGSVGDLLLERGVALSAGDLVSPSPGTRLVSESQVIVRHARRVIVRGDGRVVRLRTLARSPLSILEQAGLHVRPGDLVKVDGRVASMTLAETSVRIVSAAAGAVAAPGALDTADSAKVSAAGPDRLGQGPDIVEVFRAVPVTVVEDGVPFEVAVAGDSVGEALAAAGITVYPEDQLHPSADSPLRGGMRIGLERATPFVVLADDDEREVRAWAETVGEGLERAGIHLRGRDYSVPDVDARLAPNLRVQVVRVVEDFLVREVAIPYQTVVEPDSEMPLDETKVLRPGVPGMKTQRLRITYEDGEEVTREIEEEAIVREPVSEILAYGVKVVWRTVETPSGPRKYWRHMRVYATSYSAARAGTPTWVPWYGRTRLGMPMRRGIVAVDPRYIPMRTNLYVPGYGIGFAGDTGGGIKRYHIDLGFDDDNYESWHQYVDLYLLEPLPPKDEIRWVLP